MNAFTLAWKIATGAIDVRPKALYANLTTFTVATKNLAVALSHQADATTAKQKEDAADDVALNARLFVDATLALLKNCKWRSKTEPFSAVIC